MRKKMIQLKREIFNIIYNEKDETNWEVVKTNIYNNIQKINTVNFKNINESYVRELLYVYLHELLYNFFEELPSYGLHKQYMNKEQWIF